MHSPHNFLHALAGTTCATPPTPSRRLVAKPLVERNSGASSCSPIAPSLAVGWAGCERESCLTAAAQHLHRRQARRVVLRPQNSCLRTKTRGGSDEPRATHVILRCNAPDCGADLRVTCSASLEHFHSTTSRSLPTSKRVLEFVGRSLTGIFLSALYSCF
ncbi:hypothetical protein K469DRAFT_96333 [Zopfia rhizophila CBS 207.26]|uniref:Uncharacterized protein n=1 Tax=Zopfia rhizophila CBS 207.26 TaxID=1314779 RepID=A0A6A6D721_9PEZI|nr:hypothetical protein K469DRAFT_96333 [Zopfia rhizophila CBS 207.26]